MTEQDPVAKNESNTEDVATEQAVDEQTADQQGVDPAPVRRQAGWLIPVISLAAVILIGVLWWNGRAAPERAPQKTDAVALTDLSSAEIQPQASATQPVATPSPLPLGPTATPIATEAETIVLPTVTPTLVPGEVPSRTVTLDGTATLRLLLQNDNFASNGGPVDRAIGPRTYELGGAMTTVADQWCIQLGLVNLLFDMTLALNPVNGAVNTTGTLGIHGGFCDAPGPQQTSGTLDVEVPADASAQLVRSLQTESHLLEVTDLLNIDTGVFVELVIANTRQQ